MVTWRHYGQPCVLDFASADRAAAVGVALAELGNGRTDVFVEEMEIEETDEMREIKARVWERLERAIRSDVIPEVFA
jgi:hypothetical protein